MRTAAALLLTLALSASAQAASYTYLETLPRESCGCVAAQVLLLCPTATVHMASLVLRPVTSWTHLYYFLSLAPALQLPMSTPT